MGYFSIRERGLGIVFWFIFRFKKYKLVRFFLLRICSLKEFIKAVFSIRKIVIVAFYIGYCWFFLVGVVLDVLC